MQETTYVKQSDMKKRWPLTATLLKERENKIKCTLITIIFSNYHIYF